MWKAAISLNRLHMTLASVFLVDLHPYGFFEIGYHTWAAPWRDIWWRTEHGFQMKASREQSLKSKNLPRIKSYQQRCNLGIRSSLSWAFRWTLNPSWHFDCSLMRDTEDPSKSCLDTGTEKLWGNNVCHFTLPADHLLHTIDNQNTPPIQTKHGSLSDSSKHTPGDDLPWIQSLF